MALCFVLPFTILNHEAGLYANDVRLYGSYREGGILQKPLSLLHVAVNGTLSRSLHLVIFLCQVHL